MKNKKVLHIIMPMAGEGSRFKEAGYDVPKPLIKVEGKELYRHALDSVLYSKDDERYYLNDVFIKYTFIVREEFVINYNIDKEIKKHYKNANIITIKETTRGALETLMLAKDLIDDNDYVISIDCDIKFDCPNYVLNIYKHCINNDNCPMVLSFYSKSPIYSYVKPLEYEGYGNKIVEKEVISNYALGGCYCLGKGKTLKEAANQYIKDFEEGKIKSKELYLSLVINYIMNILNTCVEIYDMNLHKDHYWSFGTPYDLEHYNYDRNIWDN